MTDSRFTVPAIRCAGCIAKIEREIGSVAGVDAARVNFSAKRVAVRHDPAVDAFDLLEEFRKIGFEAQIAAENPLAEDDKESKLLLRAVAVAGFGMMNIMLLSVSVWAGAGGVTRDMFHWLSALIALPVIAYAGRPFFASAWMALRYRRTNMDVPISIGVLLAAGLSVYETMTGGEHAYFDGAVMLLFFLLCGRALDATMRGRTREGIGALLGRMGKYAQVVGKDGQMQRLGSDDLAPGMVMQVAAGEALAADGIVEDGVGAIDNAMLTGESKAEPVRPGSEVHAGSLNLTAPLRVRITATSGDTVLAEIARLMDEAGQSRSRYVRIADRAARLYAPAVHSLAFLAFAGWMLAGAGWYHSLVIAIAVLIITCPCALGLAVPAAQVTASSALIKRGVLVKDGSALERIAEVDTILFDKTGTLTLGEPVPELANLSNEQKSIALALAQASRHPLSRGLSKALQAEGIAAAELSGIAEEAGQGITGRIGETHASLGRPDDASTEIASLLRIGGEAISIPFSDPLRPDVENVIQDLTGRGITSTMLSGDRSDAVRDVASHLGIFGRPGMSPADKLAELERLKEQGWHPLMVGDGLNDGPALAAAHASIAPGTASDASQQAADAVFIGDKLGPVVVALDIAKATMRIVRQNFALAIGYNVLAVPLALAGMVTPLIAALAMSGSSLIVVANSLRVARAAK
ncbi:cadmium-translocating P-type ATPase [Erythrobacter jejuensis]|uniref:Cadmium-translocating P-type ATPase n=1 Tax=Parerythrobacter jejuensis TaxID=795812 RepID=A0A845AMC8_9SPHN|nr:cadmium-translocating P-type ATPase [Parerythrobacter jejuensis]MXP33389.1 cadmium-translocating P-type ATPase [Parerythrobacter jejuensis]